MKGPTSFNRAFCLIALFSILTLSVLACSSPAQPSASPTPVQTRIADLKVDPASGKSGTKLTFTGSGFASGEKVMILLDAQGTKNIGPITVGFAANESGGVTTASGEGTFKLERPFPINCAPGTYSLRAEGDKGSTATAQLQVLEEKK